MAGQQRIYQYQQVENRLDDNCREYTGNHNKKFPSAGDIIA
jgi:hypothetical protein